MAGNSKKPRKQYKPRRAGLPVTIRFNAEDEQTLQMAPHTELLKLRNGLADNATWHTLVCRLNIGLTIAHQNDHSQEAKDVVAAGLTAMRSIWTRHETTQKWGAAGDELNAIGDGLGVTDYLQQKTTRRDLKTALGHVYRVAAV